MKIFFIIFIGIFLRKIYYYVLWYNKKYYIKRKNKYNKIMDKKYILLVRLS